MWPRPRARPGSVGEVLLVTVDSTYLQTSLVVTLVMLLGLAYLLRRWLLGAGPGGAGRADEPAASPDSATHSRRGRRRHPATNTLMLESSDLANVPPVQSASTSMAQYADLLGHVGDWQLLCAVDCGAAHVFRRHSRKRGELGLRVCMHDLECNVAQFLALGLELDLMPSWNKYCEWAAVLQWNSTSPPDALVATTSRFPWPLPNHQILLRVFMRDLIDSLGCLLLLARDPPTPGSFADETPPGPPRSAPLPDPLTTGRFNLPMSVLALSIWPTSAPGGEPRVAMDATFQVLLPGLPWAIVDFIARRVLPYMVRKVIKLASDKTGASPLTGELHRRVVADGTGVYKYIREAVEQPGRTPVEVGRPSRVVAPPPAQHSARPRSASVLGKLLYEKKKNGFEG